MDRITQLRAERADVVARGVALVELAASENRRMTPEELQQGADLRAEVAAIDGEISLAEFTSSESRRNEQTRQTATAAAVEAVTAAAPASDPSAPTPFSTLGEQLRAVAISTISKESGGGG